jgi:hypothetical protein
MNTHLITHIVSVFLKRIIGLAALASVLISTQVQAINKWEYKQDLDYGIRYDQFSWDIAGNF